MLVKNVKGSSKVSPSPQPPYKSWLEYWENYKKSPLDPGKIYKCPACGKGYKRSDFDGCHVQKVNSPDKKWYIIPLCSSCNQRIDIFDVDANLLEDVPSNL
ncbi:MAG: hypothetical protein LUC91_10965 [Prevotella sp.]|nr:hypothetical protein [Prevotella sp.]